jgi:uncharacterized membrane protein YraQ (UPF0718 family)
MGQSLARWSLILDERAISSALSAGEGPEWLVEAAIFADRTREPLWGSLVRRPGPGCTAGAFCSRCTVAPLAREHFKATASQGIADWYSQSAFTLRQMGPMKWIGPTRKGK